MKNRKVYIVNLRNQDVSGAAEFGELVNLTEGTVNVFAVDANIQKMQELLQNSEKEDFILPCGSIPLNMIVSNIMMEFHGKVNLLIYDQRRQVYVQRSYDWKDIRHGE